MENMTIDTSWADLDVSTIHRGCEVLVSENPVPSIANKETGIISKGKCGKARPGLVVKIDDSKVVVILNGPGAAPSRTRTVTSDYIVCVTKTLADRNRFKAN